MVAQVLAGFISLSDKAFSEPLTVGSNGPAFLLTPSILYMTSSKKQRVEQTGDCWTACKLSVKYHSGFKCESPFTSSESPHNLIRAVWDKGKLNMQEQMMAFFISIDKQTIAYHATFMRTVDRTYGNPRYIVSLALHTLACSVILVNNHSSGILTPSPADITLTKQIKGALDLIEVKLLDHLIINEKTYLSMANEGYM
jgi:DNA repair protein RadC